MLVKRLNGKCQSISTPLLLVMVAIASLVQPSSAKNAVTVENGPVIKDPTHDELLATDPNKMAKLLHAWCKQRPGLAEVKVIGKSVWAATNTPDTMNDLVDTYALRITDTSVPDVAKQRVLIVGYDNYGMQVNYILGLGRWLLSSDLMAEDCRKYLDIMLVPTPKIYLFFRWAPSRNDAFRNWTLNGVKDPSVNIEGFAIQQLIDQWQPEVFVGVRGRPLHRDTFYAQSISSGPHCGLDSLFIDEIAAQIALDSAKQGWLYELSDPWTGKGTIASPCPVKGASHRFKETAYKVYPQHYAYANVHSLAFEIMSSEKDSFLSAMKSLFNIGMNRWPTETKSGFPVDVVGGKGNATIVSWGGNAAQRRKSRVSLWQNQDRIFIAPCYDERPQAAVYFISTEPTSNAKMFTPTGMRGPQNKYYGGYIGAFDLLDNILHSSEANRFELDPVKTIIARYWKGSKIFQKTMWPSETPVSKGAIYGMNLRIYVPFLNPVVKEVRLDGHLLSESEVDGYTVYHIPCTFIEVAIPPEKLKAFHLVSIEVKPDRKLDNCEWSDFEWMDLP